MKPRAKILSAQQPIHQSEPMLPGNDSVLTASDLAQMLGVSLSHSRRLMEKMPHINVALPGSEKRMLRIFRKDALTMYFSCADLQSATKNPDIRQ
jgi:hypothetical protein